ncbi:MAG TPA: two-component regulator propeller domain-containing protein [Cyclobacteriaceae bacterium]|nr:two-component regulator propeller domain-containing protein [Cyclobacteriaceae bacterium]
MNRHVNRHAFTLLALSIFAYTDAFSQYFQSTNFREGSGLPSSESYMVFQDSKGFVWIGTDNGVVKYDGHEFVTYNVTRGLSDNTVFGFHEDHKGRIWFRTYNGALSYYENDTIRTYKYNAELKSAINSSILVKMYYDTLGELYFSSAINSAGKIDSTGAVSLISETDDEWTFIGFVGDKMIYGDPGLPRSLNSIRIEGKKFPIRLDDSLNQSNWLISSVKWRGKIYFTMHKNIFVYDGEKVTKVFKADHPYISLYVDHQDRLWTGYFNNGVDVFSDESLKDPFSLVNLSNLSVSSVIQDYENGIWISTLDQGVYYYPNLTVLNYNAPSNTRVSTVAFADHELYLGNYGGEVFRMTDDGTIQLVNKGIAPAGYLFLDNDGKLWVSDAAGTHIHQTGTYVGGRGNASITFKVLIQIDDYIIGCGSMGIVKLSTKGEVIKKMQTRKRPSSMTVSNNEIYLGGVNGVEKFDIDFDKPPRKITDYRTTSLISVENRFVIVGTVGHGLFIHDSEKGTFTSLPIADVVTIYSIVSDWPERRLWIGTEKGLFQLDFLADTSDLKLEDFSKADGLISTKINNVCRMGDNVWAISDLGISSVPLGHFSERNSIPKFYINSILFQNQSLGVHAPFVRTEEENMVIDVRAITFKGHPTFFRYRLQGLTPWQAVSDGRIFLTDLMPDKYILEVQASTGSEDWTEGLTFDIYVAARWWQTWTSRIAMIAAVMALGYLGYWLRISAIRRKQKYLELINLHQAKLIDSEIWTQERERKRIATDLHDGIGASLSSIKMQVADAMNVDDERVSSRGKEINDNLNDVIDDIKRIVYDLHPPGLERYGLQAGMKTLIDRLNKAGDVNVIFDYYGKREVVQSVSITIFRILQELINNTLKHARASEIRIHINEFDDEINIMYEDNGIGMVGSRFTGLGMHSIESRVRSLNGQMSWESNHKGTFYNFDIPY